jgi:hypothetical protein
VDVDNVVYNKYGLPKSSQLEHAGAAVTRERFLSNRRQNIRRGVSVCYGGEK